MKYLKTYGRAVMSCDYHTGIYGHNDEGFRKIRKEWRKELIRLIFNEKVYIN